MSLPGEIISQIGHSLEYSDVGNFMVCNSNLFNVFAPEYWNKLKISGSNVDSLLYLTRLIDQGKAYNFFEFVRSIEIDRTKVKYRKIKADEVCNILDRTRDLQALKMITRPMKKRSLISSLRRLEKHSGTQISLHVMCEGRDPGDFSRFNNIKSLVLENVYEGIDHLIPLPQCVEFLDIRAHSTCAYSRVLGKFMSRCKSLPVLRISELSIGIDRNTAWIPSSTTRLELFDCQILVSNTIEKKPVMNGIKTLRILDDYSKIDMVLPELENLELCKHTSFLGSIKPDNAPVLKNLMFSNVRSEQSIISAIYKANPLVMSNIESITVPLFGYKMMDPLLDCLIGTMGNLKNVTFDVTLFDTTNDASNDDSSKNLKQIVGEKLNVSHVTVQSKISDTLCQFAESSEYDEEAGIYRAQL